MPEATLERYLEELYGAITSPKVLRILLFLPLLNGEWEVAAATDAAGKADQSSRGLRFTLPEDLD